MVDAGAAPVLLPWGGLSIRVSDPENGEITTRGQRRITRILGGTFVGPGELHGTVLAGGADNQLVRPDGTIEIDARYDARTSTGAYILIHASGIRRVSDESVYFRVSVRFEAAAPELGWMQDALFIADGVREADSVRHRVYRVG